MSKSYRLTVRGSTALAAILLLGGPLSAQEKLNPSLTLDFSSTLRASDNYALDEESAGDSFFLDNRVGISYLNETDIQSLEFSLGGVLRFADLPDRSYDPDVDDTSVRLAYGRNGINSALETEVKVSRADVAFFDPLQNLDDPLDPITGDDLVDDNRGTRENLSARISFETGLAGPLGFNFAVSHNDRNFKDTVDPDYFDTTSTTVSLGTRLNLSPVAKTTLTLSQNDYSNEDFEQTDRKSRSATLGLSYDISPVMLLETSLGVRKIDEEENLFATGTRELQRTDGVIGSVALTRLLPTGSIGLSFSHDVSQDGDRSNLELNREMELRTGELGFAIGVSKGDEGGNNLIGRLSYLHEIPSGSARANLSRAVDSDDDGDVTRTQATVGLSHDLTELSAVSLDLSYLDIADEGGDDRQRSSVRAAYNHELTRNWDLSGGYVHTRSAREGRDTATENEVFLTLKRQFQTRP